MKILIDGQTLVTPEVTRGIGTYFRNVVGQMREADFANDFYINVACADDLDALTPWTREKLSPIEHNEGNRAQLRRPEQDLSAWYSDTVNSAIAKAGIDVYWSPNALMN